MKSMSDVYALHVKQKERPKFFFLVSMDERKGSEITTNFKHSLKPLNLLLLDLGRRANGSLLRKTSFGDATLVLLLNKAVS